MDSEFRLYIVIGNSPINSVTFQRKDLEDFERLPCVYSQNEKVRELEEAK